METWRHHQSLVMKKRVKCAFKGCPNIRTSKAKKRKQLYGTHHKCEECSTKSACNVYLCTDIKSGKKVNFHMRYPTMHHSNK